jgi:hypothetical protein
MNFEIKKFNTSILKKKRENGSSPVIAVIGKRGTGKSEIIKSLLYENRDIASGIVISPTESGNSFYNNFIPGLFIHHQFDSQLLRRVLTRQKKLIKKNGHKPEYDFFVILDDCMYNAKVLGKDLGIREIFANGRHFQIFLIISIQYIMDLPISLRSNVDFVFSLKENNLSNVEKLYKSFYGIFPTRAMFSQVFNRITDNFGSIVLDNLSRSSVINETIFWYKAIYPCPSFRLGSEKMWRLNEKYYDADKELNENLPDQPQINLRK